MKKELNIPNQLLPEYAHDPAERLRIMRDNYESKIDHYFVPLTLEEIAAREQQLSKVSIDIFKLEKELKEIKTEYKEKIDPLKLDKDKLMGEIDSRQVERKGEVFFVADYDQRIMITYDKEGQFISSRPLSPDELKVVQQRVSFLRRAGNDE